MTQTTKATVNLTKGDDGLWLSVECHGRKAALSLDQIGRGPLVKSIFLEWAESHFQPGEAQPDPIQVLRDLFEAGELEDHFYAIREREGQGWEGPRMVKWGKACEAARKLMDG